jgi:hypothetical protein
MQELPKIQLPQIVPRNQLPLPQNQYPQPIQLPWLQQQNQQYIHQSYQISPIPHRIQQPYQIPPIPRRIQNQYDQQQFLQNVHTVQTKKSSYNKKKANITKKEITELLTQDSYYRKLKQWPLLNFNDIFPLKKYRSIDEMFYTSSYGSINNKIDMSTISNNINVKFSFIDKLLIKFNGHLVTCGGAIVKSIFDDHSRGDIDLFFYDLTIEEANKMRLDAIEFLINSWEENEAEYNYDNYVNYYIKRNEFTTTLFISTNDNDFYEYQFIHRIYPDMSSIIGGFDLSICMIAYDGKQIYATPLGAWSIQNKSIIIDTKRRSTSFEYRLQKYNLSGIRLIFPGISNQLIEDFYNDNDPYKKMINKMTDIAKEYGYSYGPNNEDFEYEGEALSKNLSHNIQKKKDILPYIKLSGYNSINTIPYDRINIENRLINKISDYNYLSSHPKCFSNINAQQLRSDNLYSVYSILNLDTKNNIRNQLIDDIENPNLMIDDSVISNFNERVEKVRNPFKRESRDKRYNKNIDFYRLVKCFGKLTSKVIEIRDTDEYYKYRDIIVDKMMINAEICKKNLIGIKWITQNPGRQWTSSINPIIADPREWYGKHYDPVVTGIPSEVENIMRLMRLSKTESVWNMIDNDVFNVICLHLFHIYANDAWKYIL